MEQIVVVGIVIRSQDLGESDKLLKLFTPENGLITAKIKGVKKAAAKLKFAAMPFSFCEFTLTVSKGFYTVINAKSIEDFFTISYDYDKFLSGSLMLECAECLLYGGDKNGDLFILLLKAIKELLFGTHTPKMVACFFLERIISSSGFHKPESVYIDENKRLKAAVSLFESAYETKLKSALNM